MVDAGRGQDGTDLWLVRPTSSVLDVEAVPDAGRLVGSFLDDHRLLLLPHDVPGLAVMDWPSGELRSAVPEEDVLVPDADGTTDLLLPDGFAIDDRLAVVLSYGGRLVVVDIARTAPVAEVRIPGFGWTHDGNPMFPPQPDMSGVTHVGGAWFLADHERRVDRSIWEIPIPSG